MKNSKSGFTLIELVIAISVLSIAIGSSLLIFANVTNQTAMPEILNVSTGLAEQELERVTALRFSDIMNQSPTNFTGNFSSYSYEIQVTPVPLTLANDPAMAEYKQTRIIIRHNTVGSVSLTTVISRNG